MTYQPLPCVRVYFSLQEAIFFLLNIKDTRGMVSSYDNLPREVESS